ncbi:YlxR family protein [Brachybacterium avium]|uniref:YlxR family protein n=1 Tax=Brachybacterium avium TaxID=2017485 RepID=UPI001FE313EE|nr:YlxR family protein [Brachybacterium avium]
MGIRSSHRPERTCVGCHQVAPRDDLVRLVREFAPGGAAPRVRVDPSRSAHGRGSWLHPAASCLELALRRGGFPGPSGDRSTPGSSPSRSRTPISPERGTGRRTMDIR